MDLFAVILAGGVGSRFWPLSREKKSKQFLPIISEKSMIEETVSRLRPLLEASHIVTISNVHQAKMIRELIPDLLEDNLLVEPQGKNTAPSLLLATAAIALKHPGAVIAVLPADHLILYPDIFLKKLQAGAELASQGEDLLSFGIRPTFPATGYGYIQFSRDHTLTVRDQSFYSVLRFKEKPDLQTAEEFVKAGNYFWNSGMFLWKAETFVQKLEKHNPDLFVYWERIFAALKNGNRNEITEAFSEIPAISIDYALMEKASGVRMCEGDFGWSDVGSWSTLGNLWKADSEGNTSRGQLLTLGSSNNLVHNPGRLTALVDVENLIVVNTGDALLICRRDADQKVKDIVEILKKDNRKEVL